MTGAVINSDEALDEAVRWHDEAVEQVTAWEFDAAAELIERALARFEEFAGPESPDVANLLNTRGTIAEKVGDAELARDSFERAVRITSGEWSGECADQSELFPPTAPRPAAQMPDPDIVRIHVQALNHLGLHERNSGDYDAAGKTLERALRTARQWLGENDLDTAMVLNSLGMWCKFTGRFEQGRVVYHEALDILRHHHGADDSHPAIATLFHNLGGLEHTAGDFAAGEPFARRSVEIRRCAVGTEHFDYASDIGGLAAIIADQGRHDEADALYREALAIFERLLGDDHYEIAVLLHNLAAVEVARERFDSAWDLYHRSAAMKERWLGPDHPDLALTLHNLAVLAYKLDRPAAAKTFCRQAQTIFRRHLVETHLTFVACRELARVLDEPASSGTTTSDATLKT